MFQTNEKKIKQEEKKLFLCLWCIYATHLFFSKPVMWRIQSVCVCVPPWLPSRGVSSSVCQGSSGEAEVSSRSHKSSSVHLLFAQWRPLKGNPRLQMNLSPRWHTRLGSSSCSRPRVFNPAPFRTDKLKINETVTPSAPGKLILKNNFGCNNCWCENKIDLKMKKKNNLMTYLSRLCSLLLAHSTCAASVVSFLLGWRSNLVD